MSLTSSAPTGLRETRSLSSATLDWTDGAEGVWQHGAATRGRSARGSRIGQHQRVCCRSSAFPGISGESCGPTNVIERCFVEVRRRTRAHGLLCEREKRRSNHLLHLLALKPGMEKPHPPSFYTSRVTSPPGDATRAGSEFELEYDAV
jgi:hypothetical protein